MASYGGSNLTLYLTIDGKVGLYTVRETGPCRLVLENITAPAPRELTYEQEQVTTRG